MSPFPCRTSVSLVHYRGTQKEEEKEQEEELHDEEESHQEQEDKQEV